MKLIELAILGAIQGVTEFLPISSSGHLLVGRALWGVESPGPLIEVVLHIGTLLAVFAVFWRDISLILKSVSSCIPNMTSKEKLTAALKGDAHLKVAVFVITGTIPAGLAGCFLKDHIDTLFRIQGGRDVPRALITTGCLWIAMGFILYLTKKRRECSSQSVPKQITVYDSLVIGVAQAVAILPGISRSGSTIACGLLRKLDREFSAKFSFLLSIPAIIGAVVLEIGDISADAVKGSGGALPLVIGTIVAALVGYLALRFLISLVNKGKLHFFAYYCWLVGITTLTVNFLIHT